MKKYLSSLLCISLLLMATGCGKETVKDNPSIEVEPTKEEYLALYNQYLNEDHNIVYARNILQKAHQEFDDQEIEKLYEEFLTGDIRDDSGNLIYHHNIDMKRKYSEYDQYLGYYDDSISLPASMMVKYPSQLSLDNVLGEECPTLVQYDENGDITNVYVYNRVYDWAGILENGIIAYTIDAENQTAVAEKASFKYNDTGLIYQLTFGGELQKYIYDIDYDEFNRICRVEETLSWRDSTKTAHEYLYKSDGFAKYPTEVNDYSIDENGKIMELHGNLGIKIEYNENDQLQLVTIMINQNDNCASYTYTYRYVENGLLSERQFAVKSDVAEESESGSIEYEYTEDGLAVSIVGEDAIALTFDENYQLVK